MLHLSVSWINTIFNYVDDIYRDFSYTSTDVNAFAETRFCTLDMNDMYNITGYSLFRNDVTTTANNMRQYGGTAVYMYCSQIDYYPGYPYCSNGTGTEINNCNVIFELSTYWYHRIL